MSDKIKVAVVFNEPHPEYYEKGQSEVKKLDFVPYFEFDTQTPIDEYEDLTKRLNSLGYKAVNLNIKDDIFALLNFCRRRKPDVIFNFIEIYKENARWETNAVSVIELLRIPYTGAPPITLANCQNKVLAKKILKGAGIKTPDWIIFHELSEKYRHDLKYPLIVKPAFEDASVGIDNNAVVANFSQLKERVEIILLQFNQPALVEEFIKGRELNIAVLGDSELIVLPISEIDFSNMPKHLHNIVSYQAKWDPQHESYHKTIPVCPAILPKEIEKRAGEMALEAFKELGCRDYGRVDMRLSEDNNLYVLEVNPNPDLTEGAGFMRSSEAAGYSYEQTLDKIISFALARKTIAAK